MIQPLFAKTDVGLSLSRQAFDESWVNSLFGHVRISDSVDFNGDLGSQIATDYKVTNYKLGIDWQSSERLLWNFSLVGSRIPDEQQFRGVAVDCRIKLNSLDSKQESILEVYSNTQNGTVDIDDTILRKNTFLLGWTNGFTDQISAGLSFSSTKVHDRTPYAFRSASSYFRLDPDYVLSSEFSVNLFFGYKWSDLHFTEFFISKVKSDDEVVEYLQPGVGYNFTPNSPWEFNFEVSSLMNQNDVIPKDSLVTTFGLIYNFN